MNKLKDTHVFIEAREAFIKDGLYTKATPGTFKHKEFWKEEQKKCVEGVTIDNLYIPGTYYFYLNYFPMLAVNTITGRKEKSFPRFTDADLEYFLIVEKARKEGKNVIMTKPRRTGFSYKHAGLAVHEYNFFKDAKVIISSFEKNKAENTMNMCLEGLNFLDTNTVWVKPRNPDTREFVKARHQKTVNGVTTWAGYNSEIRIVTFKDNPQASVGLTASLFLFEEAALFPHIIESYNFSEPCWKDGNNSIGIAIAYGTAGDTGGNSDEFAVMFRDPEKFNFMSFNNIWEEGKENQKVGWFLPSTRQRFGTYFDKETKTKIELVDKDGNSNEEYALKSIMEFRETKKGDPQAYKDAITQYPLTPSEALLKSTKSPFPLYLIQERLAELETNQSLEDAIWLADLVIENNNVEFKLSKKDKCPDFPIKDNSINLDFPIEVYEQPYDTKPAYGVYIMAVDPYDDDAAISSNSLGSAIVMNTLTNRIVAQYTARPQTAKEFYENCRRLALYYNATINYENNKKGMFSYFENMNCTYMLADTPKILKDEQILKTVYTSGNNAKGTTASKEVNKYGRELIKTYLLEQAYGKNDKENENKNITNTHTIMSKTILKELELWSMEGNYDRVSALIMLMIYREDRFKIVAEIHDIEVKEHDDFFDRNYQKNKNSYMETDNFGLI